MYAKDQMPAAPLRDYVASGAISLCPESGHSLIKTLQGRIDDADTWLRQINSLARPLPLGANPVADAMSRKFQDYAGSADKHSLLAVVSAYRQVLTETCDAITKAMTNFHEANEQSRRAFAKINAERHRP